MCIQCSSPTLTSGTTFVSPLIIVLSLRGKQERMIFPSLSPSLPPSSLLQQLSRILNSLWMLQKACCYGCYVSYVCLLSTADNMFRVSGVCTMFRVRIDISRKVIQRFAPRVDSHEWHRKWEKMGQLLGKFSAPVVWKFIPVQLQDSNIVTEYLQGAFCVSSREKQLIGMCWALATLYQTLLVTRQNPQGEEEESRATGTVVTQTSAEKKN